MMHLLLQPVPSPTSFAFLIALAWVYAVYACLTEELEPRSLDGTPGLDHDKSPNKEKRYVSDSTR